MDKTLKLLGVAVMVTGILTAGMVSAQTAASEPAKAAAEPAKAVTDEAAKAPATDAAKPAAAEPVKAAEAAKPAETKFAPVTGQLELRKTGTINITKDASGKITSIKLVVTSYEITLDEGSKALESMDGQKVRVTGTFSQQDGKKWFTVKSVEPWSTEAGKLPEAKPAETKAPAEVPAAK